MKKFLSLITTIALLLVSVISLTACDNTPSQKEIDAVRLNAINYASLAYETILEEEWSSDYTLIEVWIPDFNYKSCKEPVKEYTSETEYDGVSVATNVVEYQDCHLTVYLENQANELFECDVILLEGQIVRSTETGEILWEVGDFNSASEPHIIEDLSFHDEYFAELRQNGYRVFSDGNVDFMIAADEIVK